MTDEQPTELTALEAAKRTEEDIAGRARGIWGDGDGDPAGKTIDSALFDRLLPLAREPIPAGYITYSDRTTGKPYESTGVRSVQVLIDRMNNVFGPRSWWQEVTYLNDEGTLCHVRICVGPRPDVLVIPPGGGLPDPIRAAPLAVGESWGGVDRGSTLGNVYKGSYTNAAKRAFAALGPGHEVYLGDADLDPDVNPDLAAVAGPDKPTLPPAVGTKRAKALVDAAWKRPDAKANLQLAATHAAKGEVGDCSTKAKASASLAKLSPSAAERLEQWIQTKEEG